jgi:hypothetical protein
MPVILPEQHRAVWLGETEDGNLKEWLVPLPCRAEADVGNFSAGKQRGRMMIHRSGSRSAQNQHSAPPMRLDYSASRKFREPEVS